MAEEPRPPELPELRQELKLEPGAPDTAGAPTWLIVDPTQHSYIQIDEAAYQLLTCWRAGAPYVELAAAAARNFGQDVTADDISGFVRFLAANNLTVEPEAGGWRHYADAARQREHGWLMWAVHNYLFIKLPLFRPEAALTGLLPLVAPLYTRTFFLLVGLAGLTGIYLVSRQFDAFRGTFLHFFSWQGALSYGVALVFVKSAHELGHAFTARRLGCRVPSMGICFLVMFPVLYTDVTDAWRLRSRKERLQIGSAGIAVELALACFATLLWSFLPEGSLKSLAFSIATVGWVMSLAVNLNPLMRFDGYYLFADALGVENLQSRAFAFGKWKMREILFGLGRPPPERLDANLKKVLTLYAWTVWVYRLVVFTGIAILVYHMAFKILGLVLFLIEIVYFIARPIAGELTAWWKNGHEFTATRRSKVTLACAGLGLFAFVFPWSTQIRVPAVLEAAELSRVYPVRAGIVEDVKVKAGDVVAAGDVLVVLKSPDVAHQIRVVERKISLIKLRLARRAADDEDKAQSLVMEREMHALMAERAGLDRDLSDMTIVAPRAGVIAEFNISLHKGRAVNRSELVALVAGGSGLVARGYLAGRDLQRVRPGVSGWFIPDLPGEAAVSITLAEIAQSGAQDIDIPELASTHGGEVAVRSTSVGDQGRRRLRPVEANYLATMAVAPDATEVNRSLRGVAHLQGEAESLIVRTWRQAAAVLVRESGL